MDIRAYLNNKGWQWKEVQRADGPIATMNCPFCDDNKQKFMVSLTNGAYKCLRENSCGVNGSFYDLQKAQGDNPLPPDGNNMIYAHKSKPKVQWTKPKVPMNTLVGRALEWLLKERGITRETADAFNLRQNEKGTALCFLYYKDGEVVNVKYRKFADKEFWNEKQTEPVLYNRDKCAKNPERLVITEGEFDCIALHQYGITACSVPNGTGDTRWIDNEWDYLQQFKEIILCFDQDEAGVKFRDQLTQRFGRWRCRVVTLPHKDVNECLMQGVPAEEIKEAIDCAESLPPDLLVNALDYITEVSDLFERKDELYGTPTPFVPLNEMLRGWRDQELTIWSGQNGSGKSTIINQTILDLLKKQIPVCMASLELPPKQYLRWAAMQWTEKAELKRDEVRDAFYQFAPHLFIVNTHEEINPERLLDCFTYAARRYGVKHFVVDSLTRLSFPLKDENNEHKKFVSDFLSFVKANNAHGHLVVHPRKGYSDDDMPGKVDIGGTGHITNLAHNVLIMWRPSEELREKARSTGKMPPDSRLIVAKNREWGSEGSVKLSFDAEIKKFSAD